MRELKKLARSSFLAGMLVLCLVATAFAETPSTATVTFFGEDYAGDIDAMAAVMLNKVRPTVAKSEVDEYFNTEGYRDAVLDPKCFGVTETREGGNMLLETIYKTQRVDGRYNAVTPDDHGDWPPHLVLFDVQANRALDCEELVAEIAYRLRLQPKKDLQLTYSFSLDAATLANEYNVMASGGDLGLFISSQVTITVNGETLSGVACHDCPSHTRSISDTVAGLYTPEELEWFGETSKNPVPGLTQMYVLPITKVAGQQWNVTLQVPANATVWMWFGRFDLPKAGK